MLRTELPQASRVVSPASARRRIAGSTSCSRTKWNWMFWRVVMCPNPRECCSATSASACSCARRDHALRDLHAHHLRVGGLALPIGAAHEAERTPLVGTDVAALELRQHVRELVDIALVGEREPSCVQASSDRLLLPCRPLSRDARRHRVMSARRDSRSGIRGVVALTIAPESMNANVRRHARTSPSRARAARPRARPRR